VCLVPAGDPPHRAPPGAGAHHRLAMVELAIAGYPGLAVDAREVARGGKSYTVLTLGELRREDPARALALVVGADAFLGFPTWHRWREIFELAHVVVVGRPGVTIEGALPPELAPEWSRRLSTDAAALAAAPAGALLVPAVGAHAVSASAIRAQLARGSEGISSVRGLLPAAVLAYIARNQLYRSRPDAT
jgi:nicotinate-nucleotide adenylyltransferase